MKIELSVKNTLQKVLAGYKNIHAIFDEIVASGAKVLLVGGAVRDLLLKKIPKDLDIEVYNVTIDQLQKILEKFGPVSLVGKAFGVLRLHHLDIDWSLPRTDAQGRKPEVFVDPQMSFKKAFARRDLTINAIGIDLCSYELVDPFNGKKDLENKVLKAPDALLFIQDPLRLFRVMQFVGRFQMQPDDELNKICATMNIKNVSVLRIEQEFKKLFLKSKRPSLGILWLQKIGRLQEIIPEFFATIGVLQDKKWHPEGDVFVHSLQALDAAAQLEYKNEEEKLIIMYAVLCHDLGKVTTTKQEDGKITSRGHAQEGVKFAKKLLKKMLTKKKYVQIILLLIKYHMAPVQFVQGGATKSAYKRLAKKLWPYTTIEMLAKVAIADSRGRNGKGSNPLTQHNKDIDVFLDKAKKLSIEHNAEEPVLKGRDLLDTVAPGKKMGQLLKKAYEIQIEEGIVDKELLKKRALK